MAAWTRGEAVEGMGRAHSGCALKLEPHNWMGDPRVHVLEQKWGLHLGAPMLELRKTKRVQKRPVRSSQGSTTKAADRVLPQRLSRAT